MHILTKSPQIRFLNSGLHANNQFWTSSGRETYHLCLSSDSLNHSSSRAWSFPQRGPPEGMAMTVSQVSGGRGKGSWSHKTNVGARPPPRGSGGRSTSERLVAKSFLLYAILGVFAPYYALSMWICEKVGGAMLIPMGP